MNHHRIPHNLYEALPYFYILIGLISLAFSLNWLGQISGGTLISAGFVIRYMRIQYRGTKLFNRISQLDAPEYYHPDKPSEDQ